MSELDRAIELVWDELVKLDELYKATEKNYLELMKMRGESNE